MFVSVSQDPNFLANALWGDLGACTVSGYRVVFPYCISDFVSSTSCIPDA